MELPCSSWILSIHASCSHMPNCSFRKSYTWRETQNYASATLCNSDETLKKLWSYSEAIMIQPLKYMKNVSMTAQKSQTFTHVGDTTKDDVEINGGWWSQGKLRKITSQRTISRDHQSIKVKPPWKNQRLRANQHLRMLKTKEHKRSEGYPAKDNSSSDFQNQRYIGDLA